MKMEIWKRCCRDLRTYLEAALAGARGGVVSVKLGRVLEVRGLYAWKRHYAWCLSKLLRSYRFNDAYVLTRQQAEELLNSLDALCAKLQERREKKRREPAPSGDSKQKEPTAGAVSVAGRERMPNVVFYLPRDLLHVLDEYARRMNMTRSDVVRLAIAQMLERMKKELAQTAPMGL